MAQWSLDVPLHEADAAFVQQAAAPISSVLTVIGLMLQNTKFKDIRKINAEQHVGLLHMIFRNVI